jgi:hypothetical protein
MTGVIMSRGRKLSWAAEPYRGLAYYGPEHALLFVGRDDDVDDCVHFLAEPRTRILLLHGQTGCGKSSFLRAGLIPALEERGFGYQFLREAPIQGEALGDPVFIRCGRDPVSRIAEAVFNFASQPYVAKTATGPEALDLSSAKLECQHVEDFVALCSCSNGLLKAFRHLSEVLLHSLVVILDQAEEVITLTTPIDEGRKRFFRFLQDFNTTGPNIKFVIALRKENFGEFLSYTQVDASVKSDVKHFLLRDLNYDEVLQAIKLPTKKTNIPPYGAPYNIYRFEFEDGLPEQIVDDLFEALPSGGVPLVMQLVCKDLFNEIKERAEPRVIDKVLYESGNRVAGLIGRHITRALQEGIRKTLTVSYDIEIEERRWKMALYALVRRDSDGTVKTDVVSAERLRSAINGEGVAAHVETMLDWLTRPDTLILRRFSALGDELFYSLGHDAIGLALHEWKLRDEEAELRQEEIEQTKTAEKMARRRWTQAVFAVLLTLLGAAVTNGWQYLYNKRVELNVLLSASQRLKRTDYNLAVWTAFQALKESDLTTVVRRGSGPKKVFSEVLSAGPDELVRPKINPSKDDNVRTFPLPLSGAFAFSNGCNIEIAFINGSERRQYNLSSAIHGNVKRCTMIGAETLKEGLLASLFEHSSEDKQIEYSLVILNKDGPIKIITLKDFLDDSPDILQMINAGARFASPSYFGPVGGLRLLLRNGYVYLYNFRPHFVIRAFLINLSAPGGFNRGGTYEEGREGDESNATPHVSNVLNGVLVVENADNSEAPSRGREYVRKQSPGKLIDLRAQSDKSLKTTPVMDWDIIAKNDATLRLCEGYAFSQVGCSIRFSNASGAVSQFLVTTVKGPNLSGKSVSADKNMLVITDMMTLKSRDIDINELMQLRRPSPQDAESTYEFRPNSVFATVTVGGRLDDLMIGFGRDSAIDLYRVRLSGASYLGVFAWKDDINNWGISPDLNLLFGAGDNEGVAWRLDRVSQRMSELDNTTLDVLVRSACSIDLLKDKPSDLVWQKETGLRGTNLETPCEPRGE